MGWRSRRLRDNERCRVDGLRLEPGYQWGRVWRLPVRARRGKEMHSPWHWQRLAHSWRPNAFDGSHTALDGFNKPVEDVPAGFVFECRSICDMDCPKNDERCAQQSNNSGHSQHAAGALSSSLRQLGRCCGKHRARWTKAAARPRRGAGRSRGLMSNCALIIAGSTFFFLSDAGSCGEDDGF